MISPGVDTLCYVIRRGVVVIPGDVVTIDDESSEWLVVGVRRGLAFLERLRPPTDAEVHAWVAS